MNAVRHFFLEIYTIIYKKTEENIIQTQSRHAHNHIHTYIREHTPTRTHKDMQS